MTLREHIEAIRLGALTHVLSRLELQEHAEAALAILDAQTDASHWTIQTKPLRLPGERP